MTDIGDSDEKPLRLPDIKDMLRELKRKPDDAPRLLAKWMMRAEDIGYNMGLNEGLRRNLEGPKITTLDELRKKHGYK